MFRFPATFLFIALFVAKTALSSTYTNVYGDDLQSCSSDGMALTGYTRNGHCVAINDDAGSHHVCINLSSTIGGNFCEVTGQPNWCSSEKSCHNSSSGLCPVQNWCVCEWAFASYIEKAGGCDKIQELKCDAINSVVLKHYEQAIADKSNPEKYANALNCIKERCDISIAQDS